MDRSLSTIDTTVIHSLSLSLRLLRLALDPSPSPPLLSLSVSPRFIVRETNENSSSKIEWKTSSKFPRLRLFQRAKLLFRWKRGLLRDRWTIGPWFNYAICQPIIFDPRFAGLSRFSRCRADYRN